jgi:hypothetical protein
MAPPTSAATSPAAIEMAPFRLFIRVQRERPRIRATNPRPAQDNPPSRSSWVVLPETTAMSDTSVKARQDNPTREGCSEGMGTLLEVREMTPPP